MKLLKIYTTKEFALFSVEVPNFQELLENQGNCIEKQLKVRQFADFFMKTLIYDALKPLSEDLDVERNQTTTKHREVLSRAISSCTFTALYESYEQIRKNNYCARKYVFDNDIMGISIYNLTLNPFHIDVSQINCTEIIEKLVEEVGIDADGDNIEIERSDATFLLSHEWTVIFLTEIQISDAARMLEEEKYQDGIEKISQK